MFLFTSTTRKHNTLTVKRLTKLCPHLSCCLNLYKHRISGEIVNSCNSFYSLMPLLTRKETRDDSLIKHNIRVQHGRNNIVHHTDGKTTSHTCMLSQTKWQKGPLL